MILLRRSFPQTKASDALPDTALEDWTDEIEPYSRILISALTVWVPAGMTKRAKPKSRSGHLATPSPQSTAATSLEPMYSLLSIHICSLMSRSMSRFATEIWCALCARDIRYIIGAGSPNRPSQGRNVLTCQSLIVTSGNLHCVFIVPDWGVGVRLNRSGSKNDIKMSATATVS